jgi:serine/threonine-protein kinase
MSPPELPAKIAGRYRTIRVIGRGGMGIVYEVEHVHTSERLALKLLVAQSNASGDTVDRFQREARASARIKSENVVRVTDAGVAADVSDAPFIVMELLDGQDLERATHGDPQPALTVLTWLRQVARALDKAHRLGIVHRDLKPENLFLTHRENGTPLVKILDFGIVKMLAEKSCTTQGGRLLGTPMYMAPEQINRESGTITGATDRYALGLIAHKLLTGRHYREGETLVQVVADVMRGRVVAPSVRGSTLGKPFDRWFVQACHTNPGERFGSAAEQIEELASALGLPKQAVEASGDVFFEPGLDTSTTVQIDTAGATGRFGGSRGLWVGALLGSVVLVAFVFALLLGRSQSKVSMAAEAAEAVVAASATAAPLASSVFVAVTEVPPPPPVASSATVVRAKDDANESPPKPSIFPPPPKRTNGGKNEPDNIDGAGEEKAFSTAPVVLDPLADQK